LPLWLLGLWALSSRPRFRALRALAVSVLAACSLTHAKTYTAAPVVVLLFAAGAARLEAPWRSRLARGLVLGLLATGLVLLPVSINGVQVLKSFDSLAASEREEQGHHPVVRCQRERHRRLPDHLLLGRQQRARERARGRMGTGSLKFAARRPIRRVQSNPRSRKPPMSNILLVDDDARFRTVVGMILRSRGHVIAEAGRASDGDRLLNSQKFDLVICDGLLPDADGATWLALQRTKGFDTPLVFISSFWRSAKALQEIKVRSGAVEVIGKPIKPEELGLQIDRILGSQACARGLSPDDQQDLMKLQNDYAKELPGEVTQLRNALLSARVGAGNADRLKAAHRLAHQIAGTAGSLGFEAVGAACAKVEQALKLMSDAIHSREAWVAIDEAMRLPAGALTLAQ